MKMMKYFILIFLYVFILPVLTQRRWQRQEVQRCYTPDNSIGVCLTLSNCPSVANIYANNINNPQIVPYLQTLKRNCGNRVVRRDPVVCCQDAYINQPRITTTQSPPTRPTIGIQTAPPTRPTIGIQTAPPIQTTQIPTIAPTPGPEPRANQNCWGPDAVPGSCIELKNCPVLLNRLKANPRDATFADFLRKSNQICSNEYSSVCCPLDENSGNNGNGNIELPPTSSPSTNRPNSNQFINRLPTVQDGCGRSNNTFRKIVGGVDARLGAWPWIALLGYGESERDNIEFKCGGSLITQRHVLTAAHCIRNDLQIVRLGEHDLRTDTETRHLDVPVARSERHPEYARRDAYADIAILYLRNTVQFTDLIKPVCLPLTNDLRTKSYVDYSPFVVGWGRTQEGGKTASVLQELQIPIFENSVCVDSYAKKNRYFSERQFGSSVLCAGILAGGKDTCQGDSGGPLLIPENIDGKFYFYELGVVSYGIGCARPEVPGVYTSVQFYLDWIQQKVAATS